MMIESQKKTKVGHLILASSSPRRVALLKQVGIQPCHVISPDIDESAKRSETPALLVKRLAQEKAEKIYKTLLIQMKSQDSFILSADTVVSVGRRILPKAKTPHDALNCLNLLSGRAHRVYSAVCLINPEGKSRIRLVETRLRFKNLSFEEKNAYVLSKEWEGKAGGYAIQGFADSFIVRLVGSYTNVIGLPLFETMNLLKADGYF